MFVSALIIVCPASQAAAAAAALKMREEATRLAAEAAQLALVQAQKAAQEMEVCASSSLYRGEWCDNIGDLFRDPILSSWSSCARVRCCTARTRFCRCASVLMRFWLRLLKVIAGDMLFVHARFQSMQILLRSDWDVPVLPIERAPVPRVTC